MVRDEKPVPEVGPLDALLRIITATIRGTDIQVLKGEYAVQRGLTIGHEPVGVIEKLGSAVTGSGKATRQLPAQLHRAATAKRACAAA